VETSRSDCPKCGQHLDRPARFCFACGTWLADGAASTGTLAPPPAAAGPTWPCTRCSYPSPRVGNFCANCGLRLNQAPLDHAEATQRRRAERQARLTPDQQDRAKVRRNIFYLVAGVVLLAAAVLFQVHNPGVQSAYLGPLALLLAIRLPMAYNTVRSARARIVARRAVGPGSDGPASVASDVGSGGPAERR
jgi:hypothetical protein